MRDVSIASAVSAACTTEDTDDVSVAGESVARAVLVESSAVDSDCVSTGDSVTVVVSSPVSAVASELVTALTSTAAVDSVPFCDDEIAVEIVPSSVAAEAL